MTFEIFDNFGSNFLQFLFLIIVLACPIAEHEMAKVEYSFPVDKIHGRISKDHKIGFAHRTASKLNYTTTYGKRSTPVSDDEKQYRTYWGQVASAVAARLKDPTKQAQDQLNFKNQNEYDTLRKYVWHLCAEEINNM